MASFCRACRGQSPQTGALDERSVCAGCAAKLAAGWRPTEAYCAECGNGPGLPHIFDEKGVCWQCRQARAAAGIAPLAQPQRPALPCSRCGGHAFVRVGMRERGVAGGDNAYERIRPFAMTFAIERGSAPNLDQPLGLLDAYVCRGCGFTELYTRDVLSIPIGESFGTEAFEVPVAMPFR